ncbi:MAG: iron chelate uptake ABC transporter family permease subunit, partial [Archaeoglobi archaeon]|nr:iron chelate uptake ABC transporter family permease subunit [Archaeoglobi archaeon]
PGELPVGIITSMLGAPFFIYLLRRGTGFGA